MAPHTPRKKRKTTTHASHTKCKLHRDDENLKKICNAIRKDGSRCGSKVKRLSRDEQLKDNFMPVCNMHQRQTAMFLIGHCEATAACGQRCNKPVPWLPCANQLCYLHTDTQLPSRLLKLPPEIRNDILDLAMTDDLDGDESARHHNPIFSLLLVNWQINAEVSRILFRSLSRASVVELGSSGFNLLSRRYKLEFTHRYSKPGFHVSEASQHRPERDCHLLLTISATEMLGKDDHLHRGIINAWSLAAALRAPSRIRKLVKLEVCFRFEEVFSKTHYPPVKHIFAVTRALFHALKSAGLEAEQEDFTVHVSNGYADASHRRRWYYGGASTKDKIQIDALFNDTGLNIKGINQESVEEYTKELEAEAKLFDQWRKHWVTRNSVDMSINAWYMVEKVMVVCRTVHRLTYEHASHEVTNVFTSLKYHRAYKEFPPRYSHRGVTAYQAAHVLMFRAFDLFCHQQFADLIHLLEQIQEMWMIISQTTGGCIGDGLTKVMQQPLTEAADRNEMDRLVRALRPLQLKWPKLPAEINIPKEQEGKDVDGVFATFMIDGKETSRLVTPGILRAGNKITATSH